MGDKKKSKQSEIFYFYRSGKQFLQRATKPSGKEYMNLLKAHFIGIFAFGILGYTIKFIHILINDLLVPEK